jgi:hypothetical protein
VGTVVIVVSKVTREAEMAKMLLHRGCRAQWGIASQHTSPVALHPLEAMEIPVMILLPSQRSLGISVPWPWC